MIGIELKLLKSKKLILPVTILLIALLLLAFASYWTGAERKQLEGTSLAGFLAIQASQSGIIALFFLFWILQFSIHLQNSGFYKMLLLFGWQREKLFVFTIFQVAFNALLLMLLNYVSYSLLSLFYGTNPFQLLINSDVNALLAQYFYLILIGVFAMTLGSLKASYVMILPVFVYWTLEGWLSSILKKKLELEIGDFLPLQAIRQIVSESLLSPIQSLFIGFYVILFLFILHFSIQRKMFV